MWRVAATQLAVGLSCVVDCPLARRALFERGRELASLHSAARPRPSPLLRSPIGSPPTAAHHSAPNLAFFSCIFLLAQTLAVVEVVVGDEGVWQRRLEARGAAAGPGEHRPTTWAELQALLARYDKCWAYSLDGAHYLRVDTAADSSDAEPAEAVVRFLRQLP